MAKTAISKSKVYTECLNWVHNQRSSVVFAIAVVSLTGVMGNKLYNQPQLTVGISAPENIKAPYTAKIENKEQTAAQRQAVSKASIPVLMVDESTTQKINKTLQQLLLKGTKIRQTGGKFPFINTSFLSIETQHYLRSCSVSEWATVLFTLDNHIPETSVIHGRNTQTFAPLLTLVSPPIKQIKPINTVQSAVFTKAVTELKAYRLRISQTNWVSLIMQISELRQAYTAAQVELAQPENSQLKKVYQATNFLELSDSQWETTQIGILQSARKILTQGIPPGLPSNILQNAVRLQVQPLVPQNALTLAETVLLSVLKSNLQKDEEKTLQQIEQASQKVLPVMVQVNQGEVIVLRGDIINQWEFDVLEHYQLVRRENNWRALGKLAVLVTFAISVFVFVNRRINCKLRQRDYLLILLITLSNPAALALGIPATWSAIGILLGSFYKPALGITVLGLLLLILPLTTEISIITLLAGGAAAILGSTMTQKLRSREELAVLGLAIALTQGGIYLIMKILVGTAFGAGWYIVLQEAALFTLSGFAWSIVALGTSPYLEKLFDLVTPIRLAELANPNRPLLKRLATETPGTFQHTLLVSTLAEAAAKKLGCNVELVRAGTLYHDIGKMHDPLGFIENQMGNSNKHETEIKDPWKSAEIIKKHVTEGLVMARKHLLPTAIQAFIPEHQGTMLIAYFYHQAEQIARDNPELTLNEADFRYDGPIPQSRETGIVMLADSCEAALRSIKDATPEQALIMLNNILRARWQDHQLVDSGLTREEMTQIAEIFVDVWQQFHHKRIAYPKLKVDKS